MSGTPISLGARNGLGKSWTPGSILDSPGWGRTFVTLCVGKNQKLDLTDSGIKKHAAIDQDRGRYDNEWDSNFCLLSRMARDSLDPRVASLETPGRSEDPSSLKGVLAYVRLAMPGPISRRLRALDADGARRAG